MNHDSVDNFLAFLLDFEGQERTTSSKSGEAGFIFAGVGALSYFKVKILILC